MERKTEKAMGNKMGSPPYYDAEPKRMSRSVGKGPGGDTFRVPSNAKYGTDGIGGQEPTRMSRSGGAGKKGTPFSLEAKGPQKSARSDKGANSAAGSRSYGVGGVSLKDNGGRYGV